jgi:hypothetical protein
LARLGFPLRLRPDALNQFRKGLDDPDPDVRVYLVGKLMRQAKPEDVLLFVRPREIREL